MRFVIAKYIPCLLNYVFFKYPVYLKFYWMKKFLSAF